MEEFKAHAYENVKLYKEKTKRWHDKKILSQQFEPGQQIVHVYAHGPIEVKDGKTGFNFKFNSQRLKHYWGAPILHVDFGSGFLLFFFSNGSTYVISITSMPPRTFFSKVTKEKHSLYETEAISFMVEKHGWKLFFLYSDDVLAKVVKEFYAHLTSPDNAFIYVRDASILFDEYSINAQYGLPEGPDEQSQIDKTIIVGLNQVLEDLCMKVTKWTVSQNGCYTIDHVSLKPHCRVWYHFLKSHLSPPTHNSTISKDRMFLLHSIMTGRKTNVGKIIFREVHHCTEKNVSTLNFPSLITTLLQKVSVPIQANEDKIPNK
ncbi:nucleolar protein 58-like [Gossypium australe]|uniref:Nucleolar protein 58-like n=1 Tax=Gossypium australe TaxID=47621 RepID=A0A5B6WFG9_9ROSI|nr:nucleolar protein 58-like [Gossypium australe]